MWFLDRISVLRFGKTIDEFGLNWDVHEASAHLSKFAPTHTLVEYLSCPQGNPILAPEGKLYLDKDIYVGKEAPSQQTIDHHTRVVNVDVSLLLDRLRVDGYELSFVLATRHGFCASHDEYKLSFRPFVLGMTIRYTDIPKVIRAVGQENIWDMSVYKSSEQLLATINGCKGLVKGKVDNRILMPQAGFTDPLLYIVQHVEPDWPLLDLPPDYGCDFVSAYDVGHEPVINQASDVNTEFVKELVHCLDTRRSDNRTDWINVAMILKNIAGDNDVFYQDWVDFSKLSSKFGGEASCASTWEGLKPGGRVTLGTLHLYARQDNLVKYKEACGRNKARKVEEGGEGVKSPCTDSVTLSSEVYAMIQKIPDKFGDVCADTFTATIKSGHMMHMLDPSSQMDAIMLYPTCSITEAGASEPICAMTQVKIKHFNRVCSVVADNTILDFSRNRSDDQDISKLSGYDPKGKIECTIYDMYTSKQSKPVVQIAGKPVTINKDQVKTLLDLVSTQAAAQFTSAVGPFVGAMFQQINVQTMNVFLDSKVEERRQTDDKLVMSLLASSPDFLQRLVFAPDAASGSCNGLYVCDKVSNIWARTHNAQVNQLLLEGFKSVKGLSEQDMCFIESVRGLDTLRVMLVGKVADVTFASKLDSNLDIFACKNGVFDTSQAGQPFFRAIHVEDIVETTTGWEYDAVVGRKHRPALETFLSQVMPIAEERRVVLTYIAHMFSGKRVAKKFLVLTDQRGGNNGKSTLAKLLLSFFGNLAMRNTPFVCQGAFGKDRSSHDAALGPTRGKRLLVADELKHTMTLDVGMFKEKAGGCTRVSGRMFGSAQQYDYVWQAGFLLIFNESDCPKIDVADEAFLGRMIVAPMRSKFEDVIGSEPFTYPLDINMDSNFDVWRSSLADLLMDPLYQDLFVLRSIPIAMTEWRQGIVKAENPVAEWLDTRIERTNDRNDYVLLTTVMAMKLSFLDKDPNASAIKSKDFGKLAKAHVMSLGGEFVTQAKIHGLHVNACFRGVRCVNLFQESME